MVEQRADRIVRGTLRHCALSIDREIRSGAKRVRASAIAKLYLQNRLEALGFTTDLLDPDGPVLLREI